MSVQVMSMVYAAHFHDIAFVHKGKKKATGEEYEKQIKVLNSNLKSVCLALADHANDEGEGSYPAVDTLVSKTELSEKTVIACLRAMKQEEIISYAGRSKWNTCNYTINKAKISEMSTWERQKRAKPETEATSVSKLKPLQFKAEATSVKPSIHPKPSDDEEGADPQFGKIVTEWNNLHTFLIPTHATLLGCMLDEWREHAAKLPDGHPDKSLDPVAIFKEAMIITGKNARNPHSLSYMDRVIKNWIHLGYGNNPNGKKNGAKPYEKRTADHTKDPVDPEQWARDAELGKQILARRAKANLP